MSDTIEQVKAKMEHYYGSFGGADMVVMFMFPGIPPIEIGQATTISYSTYRKPSPVHTCGRITPKGYTKGPRTVAGTMVMTLIKRSIVKELQRLIPALAEMGASLKADELPPFDVLITMANEYGNNARLVLYGVRFLDDGGIFSSHDLFSENTLTYIADDIELPDGPWSLGVEVSTSYDRMGNEESLGTFSLDDMYAYQEEAARIAAIEAHNKELEEARKRAGARTIPDSDTPNDGLPDTGGETPVPNDDNPKPGYIVEKIGAYTEDKTQLIPWDVFFGPDGYVKCCVGVREATGLNLKVNTPDVSILTKWSVWAEYQGRVLNWWDYETAGINPQPLNVEGDGTHMYNYPPDAMHASLWNHMLGGFAYKQDGVEYVRSGTTIRVVCDVHCVELDFNTPKQVCWVFKSVDPALF